MIVRQWQVWVMKCMDKWVVFCPNIPDSEPNHDEHKDYGQAKSRGIGLTAHYINRCKRKGASPDLTPNDELPPPPHGAEVLRMSSN